MLLRWVWIRPCRLWDTETGKELSAFGGAHLSSDERGAVVRRPLRSFQPVGTKLCGSGMSRPARSCPAASRAMGMASSSVALSSDGRRAVLGSLENRVGPVRVLDVETGKD